MIEEKPEPLIELYFDASVSQEEMLLAVQFVDAIYQDLGGAGVQIVEGQNEL